MTVTIDTLTDPTATLIDVAGTCALASTVALRFVDSAGTTVTATAIVIGTTWSKLAVDITALLDGLIVVSATETPTSGPLTFDAAAATKRTVLPSQVTCQPWATHLDVAQAYKMSDVDMDLACWIASDMLFLLSGSRWPGVCADKVRPQARWQHPDQARRRGDALPMWRYGWCSCNRGREYGCSPIPEIKLPHSPVHADGIVVTIDGNDFTDFRLLDRKWLARTDGQGWPCCQDVRLADTELHTWSVEYPWGALPDAGGGRAAASLGYQLALSYSGDKDCRLPRRIQTLTRPGTTIALLDPMTLISEGLTGLSEVDLWLASKIVGTKRQPATISTVGKQPQYRRP